MTILTFRANELNLTTSQIIQKLFARRVHKQQLGCVNPVHNFCSTRLGDIKRVKMTHSYVVHVCLVEKTIRIEFSDLCVLFCDGADCEFA